jgi:hypothetical protein
LAIRQGPVWVMTDKAQSEHDKSEALGAFHKAEIEKWWPIIKAAGIKG